MFKCLIHIFIDRLVVALVLIAIFIDWLISENALKCFITSPSHSQNRILKPNNLILVNIYVLFCFDLHGHSKYILGVGEFQLNIVSTEYNKSPEQTHTTTAPHNTPKHAKTKGMKLKPHSPHAAPPHNQQNKTEPSIQEHRKAVQGPKTTQRKLQHAAARPSRSTHVPYIRTSANQQA